MLKHKILTLSFLILGLALGYFVYVTQADSHGRFAFKLGLDLQGGTQLVYEADTSSLPQADVDESVASLKDVIERRVNLFGVAEPLVQVQGERRLIVELPGVTDLAGAIKVIGATPVLEFMVEGGNPGEYVPTGLTGRFLKRASLTFDQVTYQTSVSLDFNEEGAALFADITRENLGKTVAIYLDGAPISTPVVQSEITDGRAQITGNFTPEEAKLLVGRLNSGALPVPIHLISTENVGASLGENVLRQDVMAGIWGTLIVALFLILWYRLPGLLAVVALMLYIVLNLTIFKLIPVTLTAAGITGFILSIGMAVDANILIFERTKEEMRRGKTIQTAVHEGFARAWLSIRDSNVSSIITAVVLFWLGTSVVKGFALTLGIGVLTSMLTAITVTRLLLYSLSLKETKVARLLFSNGLN